MASKDFGPIESDYAFFMAHATEAASDSTAYQAQLAGMAADRVRIDLLDFGCGTGDFTERLLHDLAWSAESLRLTLIEPVLSQREQAARRLTVFTSHPIATAGSLAEVSERRFDVILANHVLYYVDDLQTTLAQMTQLLAAEGKLLLALAGWENPLMQLWQTGFGLLHKPVPYFAAEDVSWELTGLGVPFQQAPVRYQLRFPDSSENRLKILRFLFGDHLQTISAEKLLPVFDRHSQAGEIVIETHSEQFVVVASV